MSLSVFGLVTQTHAHVLESYHKLIFPLSVVLDKNYINVGKMVHKMTRESFFPTNLMKSRDDYSSLSHNIGTGVYIDSDKTNLTYVVG